MEKSAEVINGRLTSLQEADSLHMQQVKLLSETLDIEKQHRAKKDSELMAAHAEIARLKASIEREQSAHEDKLVVRMNMASALGQWRKRCKDVRWLADLRKFCGRAKRRRCRHTRRSTLHHCTNRGGAAAAAPRLTRER